MGLWKVLWYYLWIAPHLLQAVLLVIILHRRIYRRLPIFSIYTVYELLQFVVLFTLSRFGNSKISPTFYGGISTAGFTGSIILRFAVIYEIVSYLFGKYKSLRHFGKRVFLWATIALAIISLTLALHAHRQGSDMGTFLLYISSRTVVFMQFGLLLAIFAFSRTLRLEWRRDIYGIALGFGLYAGVELVSSALITQFGYSIHTYMDYLTMGTYHVCVLIWLISVLRPQTVRPHDLRHIPDHKELEIWNEEMERLLQNHR